MTTSKPPGSSSDAAAFELRAAQPEDLPQLLELYRQLNSNDVAAPGDGELRDTWQQMLNDPKLHCFMGVRAQRLVSSCTLGTTTNLTRGARPYGLIENVVTDVEHRLATLDPG